MTIAITGLKKEGWREIGVKTNQPLNQNHSKPEDYHGMATQANLDDFREF
jgi:hypothetical protein